jgi:anaerobic magnesium-protoporphyrin IX monomethyl ester cyclase
MTPAADMLLLRPPSVQALGLQPTPPLGLISLATYVRRAGFAPWVVDMDVHDLPQTAWDAIRLGRIPVVGVSMLSLVRKEGYRLVRQIKATNPSVKVVLGGVHPTAIASLLVESDLPVDAVVMGEGEETLSELLCAWVAHTVDFASVRGIVSREHGNHGRRPLIEDLDSLPAMDYDLVDINAFQWPLFQMHYPAYVHNGVRLSTLNYGNVQTGRGCIGRCSFCNWSHWAGRPRLRSADAVLRDLHVMVERGVRAFNFNDETFGVDRDRSIEICRKIIDSGLKIFWQTAIRADLWDEELFSWMHEAGCVVLAIGIESGSDEVLHNLRKDVSPTDVRRAFSAADRCGLQTFGLIMIGSPGETDGTIDQTISLLKDIRPSLYSALGKVLVFPGTELERRIIRTQGFDRSFWLREEDGAPTFLDGFSLEDCNRWNQRIASEVPWAWLPQH